MIKLMTTATAALLATVAVVNTAPAAEPIHQGRWQYTVTTQMKNLPQGMQLPPDVQRSAAPGGMTITETSCVNSNDPTAELRKPHGPRAAETQCRVDSLNNTGETITWASTCQMPEATLRTEGVARYTGDRMEANFTSRAMIPTGQPIDVYNHVTGRYVGPCNG